MMYEYTKGAVLYDGPSKLPIQKGPQEEFFPRPFEYVSKAAGP